MGACSSRDLVLTAEVEIEFTGHCNANCTACPRNAMPAQGFLDAGTLERILRVIEQIRRTDLARRSAPPHVPRITVAGGGEPFLHRQALARLGQIRCIDCRHVAPLVHRRRRQWTTASALIQLTMNWAQKSVLPTRATIIYASEPVWGGVVGRTAGDRLLGLALLGAALIVAGVVASERRPRRSNVRER